MTGVGVSLEKQSMRFHDKPFILYSNQITILKRYFVANTSSLPPSLSIESLTYSGTWSFVSSEKASKFKYTTTIPSSTFTSLGKIPDKYDLGLTGYFVIKDAGSGEKTKIQEHDVTITFHTVEGKEGKRWTCQGSGNNQYGKFTLVGEYRFKGKGDDPKLHLEKTYIVEKKEKKKKKSKNGYGTDDGSSDSEDDDFDDIGADEDELNALKDEAEMSVEELRKKAYGGGGESKEEEEEKEGSSEAGESPKKKKRRVVESDEEGDF